ncbi:MAG: hypothetical protein WCL25_00635 [bacterium]
MKIVVIVLALWIAWLGYQYVTKSSQASNLVQQEMEKINSLETDLLLDKIGKLPEYKEITVDNNKYWISWGLYGQVDWTASEGIKEVQARGKVEFVELLPFTNMRVGYPFKLTIKIHS